MSRRLIEDWMPIAEVGIESIRERVPMTPFPAPNRLHVWWARRPLVASRAAVLASLLPADADRERFLHVLGIHGDPVAAKKRIAAATRRGERLGADAYGYKRLEEVTTKTGRKRQKWVRGYRAPTPEDEVMDAVRERLAEKLPEWEALDMVPSEVIEDGHKTLEPLRYGMTRWQDLFSPRQLLGHGYSVEVFRELLEEEERKGALDEVTRAAFGYIALAMDTMLNYNSRSCRWDVSTARVRSVFDRHDFAFVWSYAEMAPLVTGIGFEWAFDKTEKCVKELIDLARPAHAGDPHARQGDMLAADWQPPPMAITCKSGDNLDHIEDASIDAVVMDPPYYDNVMYAELADFFYVWLKRTAGYLYPELFRRPLTDKELEAVANPARFRGEQGAARLAHQDYQRKMALIFAEARRVLKADGILTLMFTHKASGAWDALTSALMEAGFIITASWPINTEAAGSLHIKDKSAANSTIFLACRPRPESDETHYWEEVEPLVARAVREQIEGFQAGGIRGVDLYLASFGPALEVFSRHWPLKRGTPRAEPEQRGRRRRKQADEPPFDPYAATPEDALEVARREVKRWRLQRLTHLKANADLDPLTSFFVLAWDAYRAPTFPYDEGLRLARVCGVDLDTEVVKRIAEKKSSNLILWDAATRAAKGTLGPADGSRAMLDALHHAAQVGRNRTLDAAKELLEKNGVTEEPGFAAALEAVLEVLPVGTAFADIELPKPAQGAGADFDTLEKLRRLAYAEQVDEPEQLSLCLEE